METYYWLAILIGFILLTTYLLKKFTKAETWYFVSLVKTKKFLPWPDKFMFLGKLLDWFANIGLVIGFGCLGAIFLFGKNKKLFSKLVIAILTATVLTLAFQGFTFLFPGFLNNPFISDSAPLLVSSFALFGFAGFAVSSLFVYAIYIVTNLAQGVSVCPGVAPIIPGIEIPGIPLFVPAHAWISLFLILLIHEGTHGVIARRAKIALKSAGLLLIGIFPIGAFVEPDDKQLKKTSEINALRIFAAGPTANLFAMLFIILLFNLLILTIVVPFISPWEREIKKEAIEGVVITNVDQNIDVCGQIYESPAYGKLKKGMRIIKVDDKNVSSASQVYTILIRNSGKRFTLTLQDDETIFKREIIPLEVGALGFQIEDKIKEGYEFPKNYLFYRALFSFFSSFIGWLVILNLLIAIVNFLPIEPFDGGKMAKILLLPYFSFLNLSKEDTQKFIGRVLITVVLTLLIINALPIFI